MRRAVVTLAGLTLLAAAAPVVREEGRAVRRGERRDAPAVAGAQAARGVGEDPPGADAVASSGETASGAEAAASRPGDARGAEVLAPVREEARGGEVATSVRAAARGTAAEVLEEARGAEVATSMLAGARGVASPVPGLDVALAVRAAMGDASVTARALEGLPPFPGAHPEPLAADALGPGTPLAVATFTSRAAPAEVLGFYRSALLAEGLPALELAVGGRAVAVGYVEPGSGAVHLVTAVTEGEGTRAFVSSGVVREALAAPARVRAGR